MTARIPDVCRHWSSIDIFLFSNGQDNTPPRKYHLMSDELQTWDAILSHLTELQYGSNISRIELYTVDGRKVNGPLELTHGSVYVAVVYPEEFQQTGYCEYLMKASRSWEKRQEYKCCLNNLPKKDNDDGGPIIKDDTNNATSHNNEIANQKLLSNLNICTEFPLITNHKSTRPKAISNKNNMNHEIRPIGKNLRGVNKGETQANKPFKETNSSNSRTVKHQRQSILRKVNIPKVTKQSKISGTDKDTKIKSKTNDDLKIVHTFDSDTINESVQYDVPKVAENVINPFDTSIIANKYSILSTILSGEQYKLPNSKGPSGTSDSETIKERQIIIDTDSNQNTVKKTTKDQSISIKRGGVLSFKLNIHLNDYDTSIERDNNNELKRIQSNISLHATEKASQVNIDFNISNAKILKDHTDAKDEKIIVYCYLNDKMRPENLPFGKENCNVFYLLPAEKSKEKYEGCRCENDNIPTFNKTIEQQIKYERSSLMSENIERVENMNTNSGVASYKETVQSITSDKIQQSNRENDIIVIPKYNKLDKFTQTEWCDILLEARCQPDGHYTLHLPPLDFIKKTNHPEI